MNMIALDKLTRGISLWREDVIKFGEVVKGKTLSEFLREHLHVEMSKHRLSKAGRARFAEQLQAAMIARKTKHPNAGTRQGRMTRSGKTLTVGEPEKIVAKAVFVKTADNRRASASAQNGKGKGAR